MSKYFFHGICILVSCYRLSFIHDLSHAQQLVSVVLKLLEYCVKVKVNRQYLNRPTTNAMKIMLATLNLALRLERDHGSQSGGATVAERVLKIMEILLHEASTEADVDQVFLFLAQINPLVPNVAFLYPLKTSENCKINKI